MEAQALVLAPDPVLALVPGLEHLSVLCIQTVHRILLDAAMMAHVHRSIVRKDSRKKTVAVFPLPTAVKIISVTRLQTAQIHFRSMSVRRRVDTVLLLSFAVKKIGASLAFAMFHMRHQVNVRKYVAFRVPLLLHLK